MTPNLFNRRDVLKTLGLTAGAAVISGPVSAAAPVKKKPANFVYCLNMATIREQNLGFVKELEVASKAGFPAVEIWMNTFQTYLQKGGTVAEARRIITDLGLTIADGIAFATWIVDDDAVRAKAVEQMKGEMALLAEVGCKRIAAPPMGAAQEPVISLDKVADRYRAILELGEQQGVIPQLEMWGFSKNLSHISDVMYVVLKSGHASARVLLDVFHIYKGGSSVANLPLIGKPAMEIFHMNDHPAGIPVDKITDADRTYPGDGVAPIREILKAISDPAKPLVLSCEVFNKNYYAQDALLVAKTALAKMKAVTKGL